MVTSTEVTHKEEKRKWQRPERYTVHGYLFGGKDDFIEVSVVMDFNAATT